MPTIKEAALDVMRRCSRPMTSREVYDAIIEAGTYKFNSVAAAHIVQTQIRRYCRGVTTKDASRNKFFSLVGNDLYLPLESLKTTANKHYSIENELLELIQRANANTPDFANMPNEKSGSLMLKLPLVTTTKRLIDARLGQGRFRSDLEKIWNGRCAVTGCPTKAALRASHIKSWALSTDEERLDANNGLLLVANLDALFDQFWISFSEIGKMLVSKHLSKDELLILGADGSLRKSPNARQLKYLEEHRVRFLRHESGRAYR